MAAVSKAAAERHSLEAFVFRRTRQSTFLPFLPPAGGVGGTGPRPVGGVSLAGSGAALAGLGSLKGVALDANGRLVLIAEDGGESALPLRLDDIVTIFRCVYVHGEAP